MRVVVDSNVILYSLLDTQPFAAEAGALLRSGAVFAAPGHWQAEIANVLWVATRRGLKTDDDAAEALRLTELLQIETVPVADLAEHALALSLATGVAVYDTLFVELAHRRRVPLATFDGQVLKHFPSIAKRPSALMKRGRD